MGHHESVTSPTAGTAPAPIKRARTCYDHLAGRLGIEVTDALTASGVLHPHPYFGLTADGITWLDAKLAIDVPALLRARRPAVRSCLDWTERRPHLAGGLGAALCTQFLDRGWIARTKGSRAVDITPAGEQALRDLWNLDLRNVA